MSCIFCKIVNGEIPSFTVYEDEQTLAFLDIRPVNAGHTLVVHKNPGPHNIFDVSKKEWAEVMETVRKVAVAVEKGMKADGVNLMMNNREHAGQLIAEHLHVHVIPRFKKDGLRHWAQRNYGEGEAQETVMKIKHAL